MAEFSRTRRRTGILVASDDSRKLALDAWVSGCLGEPVTGTLASSDASFRRYFRFSAAGRSCIGMDAPPEHEDCRPFVKVAELLSSAGVNVPEIYAQDLTQGFLLLSDMGTRTWLEVLDESNASRHFSQAIDALIRIQAASWPGVLPDYDEALLRRELALFPHWYVQRHLGMVLPAAQSAALEEVNERLVAHMLNQPRVFVHRDYMPRNLMDTSPNPGVIDFQDAVYGPVSYDPICLFRDAFLSWPDASVTLWLRQYHERARDAGIPVPACFDTFLHDCDLTGAQRHLKVIGIFSRIYHRDGKDHYVQDVPRFLGYLRQAIARRAELAPLRDVLTFLHPGEVW